MVMNYQPTNNKNRSTSGLEFIACTGPDHIADRACKDPKYIKLHSMAVKNYNK